MARQIRGDYGPVCGHSPKLKLIQKHRHIGADERQIHDRKAPQSVIVPIRKKQHRTTSSVHASLSYAAGRPIGRYLPSGWRARGLSPLSSLLRHSPSCSALGYEHSRLLAARLFDADPGEHLVLNLCVMHLPLEFPIFLMAVPGKKPDRDLKRAGSSLPAAVIIPGLVFTKDLFDQLVRVLDRP